jgi:hypothetical protein
MKPTVFLAIIIAAAAACSSATVSERDATSPTASTQSGPRTDTLSIRLGQSASVDGGRFEIKFETRVADSRCPANVVCVWAGDAHVRLTTRISGGASIASDLHSTTPPTKLTIDRYTITMVGMTPYPGTGRDADAPVVILRVSSE